MKKAIIGDRELDFNGNCKTSRIEGAILILDKSPDTVAIRTLLAINGLVPDGANMRRYAKKIKAQRLTNLIRVTD